MSLVHICSLLEAFTHLGNLTPESTRRCFSFSFPVSIWHRKEKKKNHIPHLTQALKKSQIHWSLPSYGFSITAILHPSLGTVVPIDFCNGEGKMFHFFRNDVLKLIKYDMTFMLWKNLYVRTACRVDWLYYVLYIYILLAFWHSYGSDHTNQDSLSKHSCCFLIKSRKQTIFHFILYLI